MTTFSPLAPVVVEGAVDRFLGRAEKTNPYSRARAAEAWSAWVYGWQEGDRQLKARGDEELRRWLEEAA